MKIEISDFGAQPDTGADTSPAANLAGQALARSGGGTLRFAPGVYHFQPKEAFEQTCWVSNHDSGVRRIGMPLIGLDHLTIEAEGAVFIFHGRMIPVWLSDCRNVRWTGGEIRWAEPMHFEAEVTASDRTHGEFSLIGPGEFVVRERQGYLRGDGWEDELHDLLFYDPTSRRIVPGTEDHFCNGYFGGRLQFEDLGQGRFRINRETPWPAIPPVGSRMVLQANVRDCPGMVIDRCTDVRIDDLVIRHCINVGVLAQNSADLTLQRVEIAPDPSSDRLVSSGNDATHFVGCSGLVALHDCRFQGMLDDATNVHGHYARIQEQPEPNQVLVRHMHGQQRGFQLAAPGEQVAWVDPATFAHRQILTVTAFTRVDAEQALITFDAPWDTGTPDGLIENLSRNRARGMLVATRGSVRITNNHIAAPGAGIAIIPDCNYWFESSPTRNVLIEGNTFDQCLSSPGWGDAAIFVQTELKAAPPDGFLHGTIRIEDNTFRIADPRVVQAHSVSELSISGNRLEPVPGLADAMNSRSQGPFNIRDCGEVELSDNALI